MLYQSSPRATLAVALTGIALTSMACLLAGCASVGSTPPYVSDSEKAKAQNPCPAQGDGAQDKPSDCKKSDSK